MASRFRGPELRTFQYQPGVSVLRILQDVLRRNGNHVALIEGDTGEIVTASELLEQSNRIAAGLQLAGVTHGDLVVLCCNKSILAISLILGSVFTGATVILVPPCNADTIDQLTQGQAVKALFYDSEFGESVSQSVSRMPTASLLVGQAIRSDPTMASLLDSTEEFTVHHVEDVTKHVPIVLFSSGTTGQPKGVEISNMHLQLCGKRTMPGVLLTSAPLYMYSVLCSLLSCIYSNHPLVVTNSNNARHRLQLLGKYKVKSFSSNNGIMIQCINEPKFDGFDLSSVEEVLVGGELVLPNIIRPFFTEVLKGRAVVNMGYGSTEAGIISTLALKDNESVQRCAVGACGKLVHGVEVKVLDDSGALVDLGLTGRIWVKSSVYKGYWRRDDLNRDFLDSEGFFDTGDAGCFDSEGNLYLRGRSCDLINFRGIKISPAVLENLLMGHPAVRDAVVVGRPHPSDGQHPTAYVVLRPQHLGTASEADIRTYVDEQVEDNMKLRGGVHFRESLPRVPNGKFIRKMV